MSCKFENMQSVGDYSEWRKEYGTGYYSINGDGDWEMQEDVELNGDSETDDSEYEHDHYECRNCQTTLPEFDCSLNDGDGDLNAEDKPRVDGDKCCVVCHTWTDYEAITKEAREAAKCARGEHAFERGECRQLGCTATEPIKKQPEEEFNLSPDALGVVEEMLKGVK